KKLYWILRRRLRRATSSLRTRWRRLYRRQNQTQGGSTNTDPQTRAPAADGFLAKFSSVAGAPPSQNQHFDSGDPTSKCWQNRLVVDPTKPFHYRWLVVVSLAVLYNFVFVIGRSVFWELNNAAPALWWTLDYTCDAIYLLDTLIHAHEGKLPHIKSEYPGSSTNTITYL
ncbi:hypothetical protein L9F63_003248, partial [Diploptera punctata]